MNAIEVMPNREVDAEFDLMPTPDLLVELQRCVVGTVEFVSRAARIVRVLDARGERVPKLALVNLYRAVGQKSLLPELVVKFADKKMLMSKIATLPAVEQKRLAEGEPIPVAVFGNDGEITHRMVDPADLQSAQITQVFGDGRLRSMAEQAPFLDVKRIESRKQPLPDQVDDYKIDEEREEVIVGRHRVPFDKWIKIARVIQK